MKQKAVLLFIYCMAMNFGMYAQTDNDSKPRVIDRTDIIAFHRQILGLKEYAEERSKIPSLQKANKVSVKVKAIVDTVDNGDGEDDTKATKLTGYIRQEIGDNAVNIYEVTYDRTKKKITAVVPSGDSVDAGKKTKQVATKKPETKKVLPAKVVGEDDDEDDDVEKPAKKVKKEKDQDKDRDSDDDN